MIIRGATTLVKERGFAKHEVGMRQLLGPENVENRWPDGVLVFDSQAALLPHV